MGLEFKGLSARLSQMILSMSGIMVPVQHGSLLLWHKLQVHYPIRQRTRRSCARLTCGPDRGTHAWVIPSAQEPVQGHVDMEPELQNELEATETSEVTLLPKWGHFLVCQCPIRNTHRWDSRIKQLFIATKGNLVTRPQGVLFRQCQCLFFIMLLGHAQMSYRFQNLNFLYSCISKFC